MTKNKALEQVDLMKNVRTNLLMRLVAETDKQRRAEIREEFNKVCEHLTNFRFKYKELLK